MPRVLITGAAGFIGMHASIRFLEEGWDVVGLDNMNNYYSVGLKRDRLKEITGKATKLERSFKIFEADLNSDVWNELESYEFEAIVHLAAQAGVRYSIENPDAYLESNVLGFQKVLDFVKMTQIQRFVYASSSSVYGTTSEQPFKETESCNNPESYYAATKKMNELMAKSYFKVHEISSIGLRFFTVYGPWGRPDMAPMLFADAAFNNKVIKVFNYGNQSRDFTYIDDIVEGIFRLIKLETFPTGASVCNIGNGAPIKLLNFIMEIEKATSIELKKELVEAQKGDVAHTYADTSNINELTGYRAKTDLHQGVLLFIDWYKKYYKL
jgi:UDP-glucuronate 4-epimerase